MKKTFLTLVTFIALLFTTVLVSANYNFTAKDKQLVEVLTNKVEQVISQRWERFRTTLISSINNLALKHKSNIRVSSILKQVAYSLDNNFEKDLDKILNRYTNIYSIVNWAIYMNDNNIYWEKLKKSNYLKCYEDRYYFATDIIWENDIYLLFNVSSWLCDWGWQIITYLLNKKNNISKIINMWNKLYSYDSIKWDYIYVNQLNWWSLSIARGSIALKDYYEKHNCPECWIELDRKLKIKFNDLINYTLEYPIIGPTNTND